MEKPIIYTVGCSFTAGVGNVENYLSWPAVLANMFPNYTIKNFSQGGSSIHYSILILKKLFKEKRPEDLIIFQGTCINRLTFFSKQNYKGNHDTVWNYVKDQLKQQFPTIPNYYQILPLGETFSPLGPWLLSEDPYHRKWLTVKQYRPIEKTYKSYLSNYPNEYIVDEYINACLFAQKIADYAFVMNWHQGTDGNYWDETNLFDSPSIMTDWTDIDCLHDILGPEKYQAFLSHDKCHFGMEGLQWIAKLVANKIRSKIKK